DRERGDIARLRRTGDRTGRVNRQQCCPEMLARCTELMRLGAVAEHVQLPFLAAAVGLIVCPVADEPKNLIAGDAGERHPFGLEVGSATKADISAKTALENLRQRHGRLSAPS